MENSVNNQKAQSTKLKKRTQEKSKHLTLFLLGGGQIDPPPSSFFDITQKVFV